MAVKTITIDLDAYELLAQHKKPKQSFSQVIKEHFGKKKTADQLRAVLQEIVLSESTLEAIEKQLAARRANRARVIRL
ncbi:MAG: antitoxin VapB family protein [Acidobacteria bacterium]|nr:antitoxin VapB family protein [Acidobacteriota bacterium]